MRDAIKVLWQLNALVLIALLAGCSAMPSAGPTSDVIVDSSNVVDQQEQQLDKSFQLINLSKATLPTLNDPRPMLFSEALRNQSLLTSDLTVAAGDVLLIQIWEATDDGLFASTGQRQTSFTLTVSNAGKVVVPYAGDVAVVGKSVHQIRDELLNRYKGKAIDPEILVEVKESRAHGVSVLGAVKAPGHFDLPSQGIRLLDLIAMAGGVPNAPWENTIKVIRDNTSEELGFDRVLSDTQNNIFIVPGDTVQVDFEPRQFAVYGAIAKPGVRVINKPKPNLSDLLAESGGLKDLQAEASSIFIFKNDALRNSSSELPVIYRLDLSKPESFLLANEFYISVKDVVYVASADASEFRKFMTMLFSPISGAASF